MRFADHLTAAWYANRPGALAWALSPFALVFGIVTAARRAGYRHRWFAHERLSVPVVVVGNITVGGTGKTPLVAALAGALAQRGWHPGCISRGYGRRDDRRAATARLVTTDTPAAEAGDEPLLLARRGIPVAVARDRLAAGRLLLAAHPECDLIIADDGLQHYRLARDVEIAVIDEARRFGNGWLLPAGPLREPVARLDVVAAVVVNGAAPSAAAAVFPGALGMTLVPGELHRVDGRRPTVPPPAAGDRIHAVAGIGDPLRFFRQLRALGLDARYHAFPDHHGYLPPDLAFGDELPIVMTEKDAVKCVAFASERCWYLPVEARLDPSLVPRIEERLRGSQAA